MMHFSRLAKTAIITAFTTLLAVPAAQATDDHDNTTDTDTTSSTQASLLGASIDLEVDGALMGHPTNYPHRHRRRRVVRRAQPAPAPAPRRSFGDDRSSIYFGIGGMGNFFIEGDRDLSRVYEGGGGFDLAFGARFNRYFALELNYFLTFQQTRSTPTSQVINDATLQGVTLDGKLFFVPSSARIEPYAQFGLGAYMLSETFQEQLAGVGLDLGLGVDIRFSQHFALGGRVLYRGFHVDNSSNNYYAVATQSAFLNTISAEAYIQFHF